MSIKFNRSQTFATNGVVTAAGLHNLVDGLDIYQALITDQTSLAAVAPEDSILIADASLTAGDAPRQTTVQNLFEDALSSGTYVSLNLSGALTYGTATGNRTVSTSATITTGTIPNLTAGTTRSTAATITNGTITTGVMPTLTAGTTTSTAGVITTGTIVTLNSTTGTIATINSTTGTIGNLSTTLAGDFTISQGTGTLGTTGATLGTYGGSTSVPVLAINAKGQVTSTGTAAITSGLTGFRNRIINGDMRIWQRGTSGFTTTNAKTFLADRMFMFSGTNTSATASQVTSTNLSGFPIAARIQRNSGNTGIADLLIGQVIETSNCQDLAGKIVSLSFYARAGSDYSAGSSNLLAQIVTGSGSDQGSDSWISGTWENALRATVGAAVLTTSWQRFSYSYTVPAGTNEIILVFTSPRLGTAGANDYFDITGVQLEEGSTATDFERRPIGTELALCQRYYENNYPKEYPVGSNSGLNGWSSVSLNTSDFYDFGRVQFQVVKRASPTVNGYNPISGAATFYDLNTSAANGIIGIRYIFDKGFNFYATSVFTAGHVFFARYTADAEL